jgi:hypothetical protein
LYHILCNPKLTNGTSFIPTRSDTMKNLVLYDDKPSTSNTENSSAKDLKTQQKEDYSKNGIENYD